MMTVRVTEQTWLPTIVTEQVGKKQVFFASHPLLPGVVAQGETEAEAADIFRENLERYLKHMAAHGHSVPSPTHIRFRATLTSDADSGPASGDEQVVVASRVRPISNLVVA